MKFWCYQGEIMRVREKYLFVQTLFNIVKNSK